MRLPASLWQYVLKRGTIINSDRGRFRLENWRRFFTERVCGHLEQGSGHGTKPAGVKHLDHDLRIYSLDFALSFVEPGAGLHYPCGTLPTLRFYELKKKKKVVHIL